VTDVTVIGNVDPDAGLHEGVTAPSTRSVADAANATTAPLELVACTLVTFGGTDTTGGVVSTTVTVND
jgi:hypothetical protein